MIWYITGKPRSGKTYYAVHKLVGFVNSNRYEHIYTNIGGFKYDKFENVSKLDFEHFFDVYIPELYKEFKHAKKTMEDYDEWIVEKVKKDGYYKSAFFVDEAQEYLSNERVHLKWLFSYQGHLGFDFYFITQALGLVHARYKYTVESVTNSVSSTYKVFSNLLASPLLDKLFKKNRFYLKLREISNYGVYQIYASTRMMRTDKVNTFRLVFRKEIFDMYRSGDPVSQSSPLLGRLLLVIVLLTGLYLYYKYYMTKSFTKTSSVAHPIPAAADTSLPHNSVSSRKYAISDYGDEAIVVPVICRNDYCSSPYFDHLPYGVLKKYKNDLFKFIYYDRLKYSTVVYIETTARNMKLFSPFSSLKPKRKLIQGVFDDE